MSEPLILTDNQARFLEKVGQNDFLKSNFYLTGGTALAAFYLRHRYSEDLDFFSEKEIDVLPINVFLESIKKDLPIEEIDFQQSFNRNLFFLRFQDSDILKTEFTFYPFLRIEAGKSELGVQIDSLVDIGVNKLFTVYQRSQIKDYIDLYFICKEGNFLLSDLIKKARIKFDWHIDPIQLGAQFMKVQNLKDMPKMIKRLEMDELVAFFTDAAKKLGAEVVE